MSEDKSENVAIAMALVIIAGLATGLGAAVVFFPSIVKLASRRVLAGSLGFSGGVMSYVSFIEIFQKSQKAFTNDGFSDGKAYSYATMCFFGGVLVMMLLNVMVATLLGGHGHGHGHGEPSSTTKSTTTPAKKKKHGDDDDDHSDHIIKGPTCCDKDPVGKLQKIQNMANALENDKEGSMNMDEVIDDDFVDNLPLGDDDDQSDLSDEEDGAKAADKKTTEENKRLVTMGMNTAIAIGLHNFPEGLATFVAALNDPRVGAVLATAIAIHNIPEGLCVALPIYYATGNRLKAFMWALLSGASEIVAALLGWAVLANSFSDTMYGILFGIVAGMMVIITTRELLPTAHFYDPEDTVVTYSFIGGMIVMAASLVLFVI
mmetsp:Transcript_3342/g.4827  ORF Transcript_3342/g.4827 Transcript_3342/m.4827 type:complete len:375 (+) Transcript_3342:124-1248(+)